MSDFVGMSREHFKQNRAAIENAVELLLADPKRRIQFQLATVYEKRTGDLLAEVLSTSFGPVVVYATAVMGHSRNTVNVGSRQYRGARPIAPLTGEDQIFHVMSRSDAGYELYGPDLIRFITDDADPATFRFANPEADALTFKRVPPRM